MGRRPVNAPYTISTEFGVPDSYALFKFHSGTDYAVGMRTNVYAPIAGRVIYARKHDIRGFMVGIFDGRNTHRLMHNSEFLVAEGEHVREGQVVALSGNSGLSTGPHVHWDIIKGEKMDAAGFGDFIDPWTWLEENRAVVEEIPAAQQESLLTWQRKVGSQGVNHRDAPNTLAHIRREWAAGEVLDLKGYVEGQDVGGNNKWFVGKYSGGFLWSGSFNDTDTHDLPNLTKELFPPEEPPVAVPTVPVEPSFEEFEAELDCVTRVIPAHRTNYEHGNFPLQPAGIVIHDYGTDNVNTTQSAHHHFRAENTTAPHFSVDAAGIYQHGRLTWRMYHAGPLGNDKIGIEVHPSVDTDPAVQQNLKVLLLALDRLFQKPRRHKHSEFMNTLCGDDIEVSRFWLEAMYPAENTATTTSTTTETEVSTTTTTAFVPPTIGGKLMDYKQVVTNIVVTFIEGFIAAWLVTDHSLDTTALVGAAAAGASAVWNIVIKPYLAARKNKEAK